MKFFPWTDEWNFLTQTPTKIVAIKNKIEIASTKNYENILRLLNLISLELEPTYIMQQIVKHCVWVANIQFPIHFAVRSRFF